MKASATYWMAVLYARGPEGKFECLSIHYIIVEDHATHVVAGIGVHSRPNGTLLGTRPRGKNVDGNSLMQDIARLFDHEIPAEVFSVLF